MSSHITETPSSVDFRKPGGSRAWAGGVIVLAGLGLIALGGCFLVGVMETLRFFVAMQSREGVMGLHVELFIAILYLAAFACFASAVVVLFIGLRGLVRVLHDKTNES